MELGERIRAARLEAGLSQRQLCGDTITRNMLSQIENGSARPSMDTLSVLAQRLGKTVSYFLEEQAITSPNQRCMEQARLAWQRQDPAGTVSALEDFRDPDDTFYHEKQLLLFLGYVGMARQVLAEGRQPYGVTLLQKAQALTGDYITPPLRRELLLLLAEAGEPVTLPPEDDALLLHARQTQSPQRVLELLGAVEDKSTPLWNRLQGLALFALGQYNAALACLEKADPDRLVLSRLEDCCRVLGDYKRAYEYACLLRQNGA